ncbi:unnamed protein product [Adineta ricciae]|uniref:TIR domain-containing protein n=2 Tax=Adineta ricciae TaxID=249248 RepID=A0A815NIF8_ADIRI|nr:unnamed protein product [Adineta ricciae]
MNKIYYKHVYYLLLISSQTISFIPFDSLDDQLFIEDYLDLFEIFIRRIDQRMPKKSDVQCTLGVIGERILTFLWNLTDRIILIPILLRTNLAENTLKWIQQSDSLTEKSRRAFPSILQNIARHDQGAEKLNQFDAIEILKAYQQKNLEKSGSRKLLISMTIALLSTPEQLKDNKKGMNVALNQLLQLVIESFGSDRFRSDGIHVSEPLQVLVKLFVVEERTLDYILNHAETKSSSNLVSTICLFIEIFLQFSDSLKQSDRVEQFTLIAITNVLWSISFLHYSKEEFLKNKLFIRTIKKINEDLDENDIIQQYKPKSMENIQQAIQGILHNLDFQQESIHSTQNRTGQKWIMISYCHENIDLCNEISKYLKNSIKDLNIWIDQTHTNGSVDLWESIAQGIEQSTAVLCFLSEEYFQSKSCRQEFVYANDSLKKPIVPILIKSFQPKGWLGIRMTGLKYIRFKDENQLEEKKKGELLNTILALLSIKTGEPKENLSASCLIDEIPSNSSNEIKRWFQSNRLSKDFYDLFQFETREELLDYAQLLFKDPERQMNIYDKIYSQKYHGKQMAPHEFLRFTKALQQFVQADSNSVSSTQLKSKTCVLS